MSQETIHNFGMIITSNKKDMVFHIGGKEITMEFHHYLGPTFWLGYDTEDEVCLDNWFEDEELVKAFDSWFWSDAGTTFRNHAV